MSDPPQNICQELSRLRTDRPQRSKYCVTASHRDASQCGCTLCAAITRATELVFKSKLKDNENLRIFVEVTDRRLRVGLTLYGKMHEILALDGRVCDERPLILYSLTSSRFNRSHCERNIDFRVHGICGCVQNSRQMDGKLS